MTPFTVADMRRSSQSHDHPIGQRRTRWLTAQEPHGQEPVAGLAEEAKVGEKLFGGLNDAAGLGDGLVRLIDIGSGGACAGVLEFVAAPAQEAEPTEAVAELSTDGRLDADMATGCGWPQPLLGKKGGGRVAGCVIGEDEGAVRVRRW